MQQFSQKWFVISNDFPKIVETCVKIILRKIKGFKLLKELYKNC